MKPRVPQKRKYNAVYRLKQKIGDNAIAKRSRIIQPLRDPTMIEKEPEAKILMTEYGFIIQPKLF